MMQQCRLSIPLRRGTARTAALQQTAALPLGLLWLQVQSPQQLLRLQRQRSHRQARRRLRR